jgi:hypothetical protein
LLNGDDSTAAEGTASPELLAELQNWSVIGHPDTICFHSN